MMRWGVFLCVVALFSATAYGESESKKNPVSRVVELLEDLATKIEKDGMYRGREKGGRKEEGIREGKEKCQYRWNVNRHCIHSSFGSLSAGKAELKLFKKYQCWCDDVVEKKEKAIKENT